MNKIIFLLFSVCFLFASSSTAQVQDMEKLFMDKCGICHTIGLGKFIGPDLAYVPDQRPEDWLIDFIRSSQLMVNSGDPIAVALYNEYNEVIMPDPMISDNEIISLINFIRENSGNTIGNAAALVSIIEDATKEDFENGQKLYEGRVRLASGGPSCISCHGINNQLHTSSNTMAKEVNKSFANLGEFGVKAILTNPPFPVMNQAYETHKLEEDEVHDLLIFLRDMDTGANNVSLGSMSQNFLLFGIFGAGLLVMIYAFIWSNRKTDSVNESIYSRQIKSQN